MGWLFVGIAGILEIGWIVSLKHTEGFTRIVPIVFYAAFGAGSAFFLSLSLKHLPMAPAYIIWMGIGMVGAALYDAVFLAQPLNAVRVVSMILIVAGVVGIRVSTNGDGPARAPRVGVVESRDVAVRDAANSDTAAGADNAAIENGESEVENRGAADGDLRAAAGE
jgi:quaternary ammonium compound-resistance protein SugE